MDFDDGTISIEVNPTKEFIKLGTFSVKLRSFGQNASSESKSDTLISITYLPSVDKAVADLMTKYNLWV